MATEPYDERKRFMEEMILRFEKAFRRVDRSIEAHTRRLEEGTASLRVLNRQMEEHRIEFKEESRAHRQALLHILDRLEGGSGGASAS